MGPPPGASPPMRMTASWLGTKVRSRGELPSDPQQTDRQAPSRHRTYTISPVAAHRPSACSDVKALRNTSAARRQAAKLCYRFCPLTPSARSADLIAGDRTKNGFPAPNKERQQQLLDRKSPIQVRISLPPGESHADHVFLSPGKPQKQRRMTSSSSQDHGWIGG